MHDARLRALEIRRPHLVAIPGNSLPAAGVTVHATDAGGAALNLTSGFTNPVPRRTLNIARSNAGPNTVAYTVTYKICDGSYASETIVVTKNSNASGLIAGEVTKVTTTVDPVSTSTFETGTGFSCGTPFSGTPDVSAIAVAETPTSVDGPSGTIVPNTAPDGTKSFAVLVS